VGLEADPVAADLARTARGLEVLTGSLGDHRFPSGHFDAITMSHVIEHLHDPVNLLRDCGRLLKPSGRLVVVTPNIRSLGSRRFGSAWLGLDPPRHLQLFSRATLLRAAAQAGLAVVSLRSSLRNADYVWLWGRGLLTGWPAPGERIAPAGRRWRARVFQLGELVGTLLGADLGEELVLIAAQRR
jgi:SAM-dependent methyltransferase